MDILRYVVLTSINSQESAMVRELMKFVSKSNCRIIVVADKKTPLWINDENLIFISVEEQLDCWPNLANLIPWNHYARKNLGYLRALELGAKSILDTDDDNCPIGNPWETSFKFARSIESKKWINVYRYFGEENLWPRGLPIKYANAELSITKKMNFPEYVDCFQSIVDGDPDIDAIGRLLFPKHVAFEDQFPILLNSAICPTNSQATIWASWLIPILYLPSTATFRMTDIWRGLIAQPLINRAGGITAFGKLGFIQNRNEHDLMKDFDSEIAGH